MDWYCTTSKVRKLEKLFDEFKQSTMIDWFVASDHSTICVGKGPDWLNRYQYIGTKYTLWAYEIGYNETTIAVKIKLDKKFKTTANFPYITLAYDRTFWTERI